MLFICIIPCCMLQAFANMAQKVQYTSEATTAKNWQSPQESTRYVYGDSAIQNENKSSIAQNIYLQGDTDILSQNAPRIVQELSSIIYNKTGVKVILHIVEKTPQYQKDTDVAMQPNLNFQNRRLYESNIIKSIQGHYAIIFLFYNDHAITLKSNLDFLDEQHTAQLLENYAYPYLPADAVGTLRYDDGVNEGVSNLYLALTHTIANHYNFELNAPKPMEQQNETTKIIIYAMLFILIGLFIIVRFGLLTFKKKG